MKIILLTHERERERPTNTGAIALSVAGGAQGLVECVVWSRVHPDQGLVQMFDKGQAGLVYPCSEVEPDQMEQVMPLEACENFVLLDATWQEARKMYNRSPYLKRAPRVPLSPAQASRFRLRRNQKPDGLCTAECVMEILTGKGYEQVAQEVESAFIDFNLRHR